MSLIPSPEAVGVLRDRLKHGHNVVQILQSQVDTAQQNIVLLQGQVRLAKETISSLKRHFEETENLFTNGHLSKMYEHNHNNHNTSKDGGEKLVKCVAVSPPHCDNGVRVKREGGRSPYAQQLRQVLDALQDDEPHHVMNDEEVHTTNGVVVLSEMKSEDSCACADCKYHNKADSTAAACVSSCKPKVHHPRSRSRSPHPRSRSRSPHTRVVSSTVVQPPPVFQVVERSGSNPPVYFVRPQSPHTHHHHHQHKSHEHEPHCNAVTASVEENHHGSPLVEYSSAPTYGYQVVAATTNHNSRHVVAAEPLQVIAAPQPAVVVTKKKGRWGNAHRNNNNNNGSSRNTTSDDLSKYTKVKRVDESKLNAQKMLANFAKRTCFAYNPRYDLDLMIVPPPILAEDMLKLAGDRVASKSFANLELGVEAAENRGIVSEVMQPAEGSPQEEGASFLNVPKIELTTTADAATKQQQVIEKQNEMIFSSQMEDAPPPARRMSAMTTDGEHTVNSSAVSSAVSSGDEGGLIMDVDNQSSFVSINAASLPGLVHWGSELSFIKCVVKCDLSVLNVLVW